MTQQSTLVAGEAIMPAEWAPHEATWLAWPRREKTWEGVFHRVPRIWVQVARELREGETVRILVQDAAAGSKVEAAFGGDLHGIEIFPVPTNDAWVRDYGPLFVVSPGAEGSASVVATCWGYNAWGGKYPPWDDDARVSRRIAERLGISSVESSTVLEGGAIDVDGEGTLLAARSSLLHPSRNPDLDRRAIEERLARHLGARRILWLDCVLEGDDTGGHVDNSARFAAPGTLVAAVEKDPTDRNYPRLRQIRAELGGFTDAAGRKLEVVELPMPPPVVHQGYRCPASYVNFYIGNAVVLVPTFRSSRDAEALGILTELFPERRVVGIDSHDLVWGLGGIHCITQQQPG